MAQFSPGELVDLDATFLGHHVSGVVRKTWRSHGTLYLRIYNYAVREEHIYRLGRNGALLRADVPTAPASEEAALPTAPFEPVSGAELDGEAAPPDPDDESGAPYRGRLRGDLVWLVSALLFAGLLLSVVVSGFDQVRVVGMSYESFLSREMSLGRLVSTVAARVSYERDVEDYWSPPDAVWNAGAGDCEDYAMVISAYLSRHGVDHQVVGFSLRDSLAGHAAVIARVGESRVLIDPTMATAPSGLERFPPRADGSVASAAEVLGDYAEFPAVAYRTPPSPGRPAVTGYIEQ